MIETITTVNVRDWLCNVLENEDIKTFFIGKMNGREEQSVLVYTLETDGQGTPMGGEINRKHKKKGVGVLVHWNKNAKETEEKALKIYEIIKGQRNKNINNYFIFYVNMKQAEPISIGTDTTGIYEDIIQFEIYYK